MRRGSLAAIGGAAILIGAPAAWYYGSPWWTLWRIREAARAGDAARLASYVDYRAILSQAAAGNRTGWTGVVRTVRPHSEESRRLIALARRQLARRFTQAGVENDIRPWLSEMSIGVLGGGAEGDRSYVVRRGLDSFEVRVRGASPEHGPLLTFRRHGLGWKLEGVRFGMQ